MGFFIIDKTSKKAYEGYFEVVEDALLYVYDNDLDERYIMVEGDKENPPCFFIKSPQYKEYSKDNLRSGKLAQEHFKKLAKEHKLIAEPIPQDQESFEAYNISADLNDEPVGVKKDATQVDVIF